MLHMTARVTVVALLAEQPFGQGNHYGQDVTGAPICDQVFALSGTRELLNVSKTGPHIVSFDGN